MLYQNTHTPLIYRTRTRQLVAVRQATAADAVLTAELLCRLSDDARHMRYMRSGHFSAEAIWREAARMTQAQSPDHTTLLATIQPSEYDEAVAVAELVRDHDGAARAEIALVVRDDMQQQGLGSFLLGRLVRVAERSGITRLSASLLADNYAMLCLIRGLGLPYSATTSFGEMQVIISLPGNYREPVRTRRAYTLAR